ncbi:hypothetical protein [Clostridium hydrogenum]|uniref:hypothetical protein n=1 Tax=Clostridium hydrogenum TaxID=2855764 RepID=UPI001F1F9932|nr:hypothetical protein [Clostridium hydrogenum]
MEKLDKRKLKIKMDMYYRDYSIQLILLGGLLLISSLMAAIQHGVRYENQYTYAYVAGIILFTAFSHISILYGRILNYSVKWSFNRKQYYHENILIILIVSIITGTTFFVGVMINQVIHSRKSVICFWYKFNEVKFLSIGEMLILVLAVFSMIYMLANLIVVFSVVKKSVRLIATIIACIIVVASVFLGDSNKNFYPFIWFIRHNAYYILYLGLIVIFTIIEYWLGKKIFMKVDIN